MLVKFKLPQIDLNLSWYLDWKIPYFPSKNDSIRIDCFLSPEMNEHLSKLSVAKFVEDYNVTNKDIPQSFIDELKLTSKETLEKLSVKENFLDIPCYVHDVVWLRKNKNEDLGELMVYLEIYLSFDNILVVHF
jgi:hypothetical protein